jgi:hypothetical protein
MSVQIEDVGKQLKASLGIDVAIIDKIGFVLYSTIEGYKKDMLISTTILNFINDREKASKELQSDSINSIVISAGSEILVFSFSKELILMGILKDYTNLDKLLSSTKKLLSILDKVHSELKLDDMADISISKEIESIENRIKDLGKGRENKFEIFKEIVNHISQLR